MPTSAPSGCAGSASGCPTARLETLLDADDLGLAVRVVVDGVWGFAAAVDLTPEAAARAAEQAVDVARAPRRSPRSGSSWLTSRGTAR